MNYAISAITRAKIGKRAKDELTEHRIPTVMYGKGVSTQALSLPRAEFVKLYSAAGFSSLIDIAVDGATPVKAVIKEVQLHPLRNIPIHIDLHQVRMDEKLTANIPLKFVGESKAVKAEGGSLIKSLLELEVSCLPADLPHEIEIDLSMLKTFDDSITVGSLKLPKGVEATSDPENTIATVSRPLTEDEIAAMEQSTVGDVSAVKTEGEEKRAAEAAKKAEEEAAAK
ncbi:50S ribosomal protein L25 [Patescibacteria group bacterium]|nr:50S ribosomal protein L25 [Patescibacteria group bacterium]